MPNQASHNYFWNTVAGLINAAEVVVLLMLVTRFAGLEDAGIVTIAFTVGNQLMTVGKFGVRSFQVTDVNGCYNFQTYLKTRYITVFLMIVATLVYCVIGYCFNGYSVKKMYCIFLICGIYSVESIEDVFWGLFQQKNRLDIGGIIFSARWICILFVCGVLLFFTKNIVLALFVSFLCSLVLAVFLLSCASRKMKIEKEKSCGVKSLLTNCFPLFLIGFLNFYILNASKYSIDLYLSDSIQACYGFVAMPVFVVGLLNSFIYQPQLVKMADEWNDRKRNSIRLKIIKQLGIIAILTGICELGAFFIGIPVLSWLYNTDLFVYKRELLILLLGGGLLAVVGYVSTILTLMRHQKTQLHLYLLVAVLAFLFSDFFVSRYYTTGAACFYLLLVAVLAFTLMFFVFYHIGSEK